MTIKTERISTKEDRMELLTLQWEAAYRKKKYAEAELLDIEVAIYELVKKELPAKGTYHTGTGMKIVTGMTEIWDQEAVDAIAVKWDKDYKFPFKTEYKPDAKAIGYIRENVPSLWKTIHHALTTKEKKPSFSMDRKEGGVV